MDCDTGTALMKWLWNSIKLCILSLGTEKVLLILLIAIPKICFLFPILPLWFLGNFQFERFSKSPKVERFPTQTRQCKIWNSKVWITLIHSNRCKLSIKKAFGPTKKLRYREVLPFTKLCENIQIGVDYVPPWKMHF